MSNVHGNRSRGFLASASAVLASLLSDARAVSDQIFPLPHRVVRRPMWVGPRVDRRRGKPAGTKLRRHAAEGRLGLSHRGY